jgi:hypothetical protein
MKKYPIGVAALLIMVLGAAAWRAASMREPVYQGKTLSAWLEGCDSSKWVGKDWQVATNAVRQIGTNSLPTLLRKLRRNDSKLTLKLIALARKQHFVKIRHIAAEVHHHKATVGFETLGSDAKPAVPGLIRIFEQAISADSQYETATSLGWIGPSASKAVPCLIAGLSNTNTKVRRQVTWALAQIAGPPDLVMPVLVKAVSDPDPGVRLNAMDGLRTFGMAARPAIPALVSALDDVRNVTKEKAADLLARFGADAKPAVPRLLQLLDFPNEEVRVHAMQALKSIDREAADRANALDNEKTL